INSRSDAVVDLRRHPMPVRIPPGLAMAQEGAAKCIGPILPDALVEGPQAIDHVAPVAARSLVLPDLLTQPMQELACRLAHRQIVFGECYRRRGYLACGQQAPPRQHSDRALVVGSFK